MMHSQRKRSRSLGRKLLDHPFLFIAALACLAYVAMMLELGSHEVLGRIWNILGFGFHLAGALLSNLLPGLSGWLFAALTFVLGLVPYAAADAFWQRVGPL